MTTACLFLALSLTCQSYGAWKFYSDERDNQPNGIVVDTASNAVFISIARICEEPTLRECAELLAVSLGGEQIYRERFIGVDISSHSIVRSQNFIFLFGNESPGGKAWVVQYVVPQSGSADLIKSLVAGQQFSELFLKSVSEIKDQIYLIGDARLGTQDVGQLAILDDKLMIDSIVFLDTVAQGGFTDIYAIDDTTIAVLYDEEGDRSIGKRHKWVAFYDTRTHQRIWEYRHSEEVDNARSRGLGLGGGDFLFDVGSGVKGSHFVRMNRDSVFKWQRDFYRGGAGRYQSLITREVIKTQDGHILIAGTCTDLYDIDYLPSDSPCLTKLDSNTGDVIWQRVIYQESHSDPSQGETGIVSDVVELPSGDLVASMQMWEAEKTAVVLLHTDSDGCITPDCGKYIDLDELAVSSEEVEVDQQDGIKVYPNPASDRITITADIRLQQVTLHHLDGRVIYEQTGIAELEHTVSVSNLSTGLYVVVVIDQQGRVSTSKVLVR